MQRHLDTSRTRYLPAVAKDGFELGAREPLGTGLRRISVEQCELALRGLAGPAADIDSAIHEARKAMKRLRAVLRLIRPQIGDKVYRYENRSLRDAARLVAPVRSSRVTVETVSDLADRFEGALRIDVFDDLSERLDRRALHIRHRIVFESDAVDRLASTLERTRIRFASWPVEDGEPRAYGAPIANRWSSIEGGLAQTYERGLQEMRRAFQLPTAVNFHTWRKRVKYLRHQMEILNPLWPEVVGGAGGALDRLGDVLGVEHDLAELLHLLSVNPDLSPDPVERSLFAALAQHRRAELQTEAKILGTRIYAEKPSRFTDRLEAYWDSIWIPVDVGLMLE